MLEDYSSNLPPKQTKNTKKEFTIVVKYPFEPRITEEKFLRQFQAGDCPREISAKWDFEFLFVMFQMKPPIWSSLFPRLQVIHSKYKLYFWQTWGSPLWVFGIFHDIFFRSHGWLGGFRPKCIYQTFQFRFHNQCFSYEICWGWWLLLVIFWGKFLNYCGEWLTFWGSIIGCPRIVFFSKNRLILSMCYGIRSTQNDFQNYRPITPLLHIWSFPTCPFLPKLAIFSQVGND